MSGGAGLVLYDAMVTAIAECARVDEVKDIRDKAVALEHYHRQARNLDAEREAANVRLRAERRVGELLRELARAETAKGGNTGGNQHVKREAASTERTPPSPYAAAPAPRVIPARVQREPARFVANAAGRFAFHPASPALTLVEPRP